MYRISQKRTGWWLCGLITLEFNPESVWPKVLLLQLKIKVTWESEWFPSPKSKLCCETSNHQEILITKSNYLGFDWLSTLVNMNMLKKISHKPDSCLTPENEVAVECEAVPAHKMRDDHSERNVGSWLVMFVLLHPPTHLHVHSCMCNVLTSLPLLSQVLRIHGELSR